MKASPVQDAVRFAPYLVRPGTVVIRRFSRALGDNLLLSALAREVRRRHPRRPVVLETNWTELFRGNPHVALAVSTKVAFRYRKPSYRLEPETGEHIIDQLMLSLDLDLREWERKVDLFLAEDEGGEQVRSVSPESVVVCPQGKGTVASNRKEWGVDRFQQLVRSLPDVPFVQIGSVSDPLLEGVGDLRGTDIRTSAAILRRARTAVILEGGLMHLCNAVGARPVVLYGATVRPEVSTYETQLAVTSDAECGPCFRSHGRPGDCPHRRCMAAIEPPLVRDLLRSEAYLRGGIFRVARAPAGKGME
jgi:ADP-heptose:LPS heptosyltransferase